MTDGEVFGRYVLERKLGRGGMAEVFLAHHADRSIYGEPLVIKRVLSHLKENRTFLEMFLREARVVAAFSHPNIVKIIDLGKVGTDFFIAMEFVDGLTVDGLARRFFASGDAMPVALVAQLISDAALGLDHVHRARGVDGKSAVVHRDISPDNLMVNRDGVTKVLDFGIARPEDGDHLTKTGVIKGKIPFMPPEQIESKRLDGRTDLYALGVSMYWLLTERRPFDRATPLLTMAAIIQEPAVPPTRFRPELPSAIDDIVLALLEKDPDHRVQSGADLAALLAPHVTLSRAEIAAIVQRRAREPDPPRKKALSIEPMPQQTRVVARRDEPESVVHVARTAVTPASELISEHAVPDAVTRAHSGESPAPKAPTSSPGVDPRAPTVAVLVDEEEPARAPRAAVDPRAPTVAVLVDDEEPAPAPRGAIDPRAPTVAVVVDDGEGTRAPLVASSPTPTWMRVEEATPTTRRAWLGASIGAALALIVALAALAIVRDDRASPSVAGRDRPDETADGPARVIDPTVSDDAMDAASPPVASRDPSEDTDAPGTERTVDGTAVDGAGADDGGEMRAGESDARDEDTRVTRRALEKKKPKQGAVREGRESEPLVREPSVDERADRAQEPELDDAAVVTMAAPQRATRDVVVRVPPHVRFYGDGGKRLVPKGGTLSLPRATKTIVLHDTARDVKTRVPVSDLPIDYALLPRGELSIRAVPYAKVFFGTEPIGTTPLPALKVVVGTYKVRLVYEEREIVRVVEVRPGDLTRISENMTK